jgi:hypothetical protein
MKNIQIQLINIHGTIVSNVILSNYKTTKGGERDLTTYMNTGRQFGLNKDWGIKIIFHTP